ncbi:phosphomethylpyrimidine synthase [Parabacteroides sp. PF5-5]|uniref:phosphomethylpyrimidine synthase ThiC n=1 Tax=unclassified Parabacteroides TaxID=2649774 RepID=UPI002473A291|nr:MULTISPECIES: phosphomethylpyrimidine synthase ThiC [unclassified Parabacteroides]MDH6306918.1 phosphomethylpyrimidine synthase [Parabacteroides sp. PH5-39]MDH6317822.1 phosphomethylpyrimidine synthase [Parabacteroides sp. PF5-13]MDH6321523.1 phosphomethylpyrimidine synthase [Parabacteroides sp. PH5-13]MDH6325305.1 phosphomethylpyrimidine synthase [Parabacteroides sp. PH5-8]MDH6328976.1 phosphomethylpyrimidine synthase [Parabacteroides sp. PH5-41]
MSEKKKVRIDYPSSEKVYIPGEINKIKVAMRRIMQSSSVNIDSKGVKSRKENNPVIVYDTSGPYSDPAIQLNIEKGIPRIREEWGTRRKDLVRMDAFSPATEKGRGEGGASSANRFPLVYLPSRVKEGKCLTQMFYAKRRIITPEMEYVAIRENQQIEDLGLKSYITPDFVRKEVAAGRAVIPANINHPEAEPMIIGDKFLVKVNANVISDSASQDMNADLEKVILSCKWGTDTLMDLSTKGDIHGRREWLIRNCPVPLGTVPLYQALAKAGGKIENLCWEIYRDTLIEQAEQGIDFFTIHAAMRKEHADMTFTRLSGIVSHGGLLINEWMKVHKEENFLYTHFAEICEIVKTYDVTLSIGSGLRPGSIYDANDPVQMAELSVMGKLTRVAWTHFVQVMAEGSGHLPMNKIHSNVKEQRYACQGAPYYTNGPIVGDIALGYSHITSAIGSALSAWHGTSMICSMASKEGPGRQKREDIRDHIIACKIAAHAADLAKNHPGAQVRDNALNKAYVESRRKDVLNLSLDPERAAKYVQNQ